MWTGGLPSGIRDALIGVVLVGAVIVTLVEITAANVEWCDGHYPRFQIPETYRGGGCSRIIPAWHGVLPWNWADHELVCLGLCQGVPLWTPED